MADFTRAGIRSTRAWLALTAVLVVGALAPGVAEGGYFEAEGLSECVGYTEHDLTTAPEGTELPFGGIRVFARDGQRGRSRTFCLTMAWIETQPNCCWASADIVLPKGLRRDAESLRFIAEPGCYVRADLYPRSKAWWLRRQFLNDVSFTSERRRKREIPERYDDRVHGIDGFLSCWGGEK